jgi:hypothetical protein
MQNVQDTKRPVFVNFKTKGRRPGILDAVYALRPARSDVVVKLGTVHTEQGLYHGIVI